MATKLSHSAANKYKTCPAMYKLHYIDRIRSHNIGSALLFGSALDEVLNRLLATKIDTPPEHIDGIEFNNYATDDLTRLKQGFDMHMTYQMINKEREDVRTSHFIEYFKSDFEEGVLLEEDFTSLERFITNAGYIRDPDDPESGQPTPMELYKEISGYISEKKQLDSTDLSFYNYASWLSLRRKGHLMIEYYKESIMPLIKRVESVQKAVELPNESGDMLRGYIDFEAEFDEEKLRESDIFSTDLDSIEGVITLDNKTSSKSYKLEDINDKGQLLIYDEYTQNGLAGYVVLLKKISFDKKSTCKKCGAVTSRSVKTCPEGGTGKNRCGGELEVEKKPYIKAQILVDSVDEEKKDLLFDELCGILEGIENNEFPQIRENNNCFQYGRQCIYYNYCRSNPLDPDITGLAKV